MFARVRYQITILTLSIVVILYIASSFGVYGLVRHVVIQNVDQSIAKVLKSDAGQPQRLFSQLPTGTYVFYKEANQTLRSNAPQDMRTKVERLLGNRPSAKRWTMTWTIPTQHRTLQLSYQPLSAGSTHPGYLLLAVDLTREMDVLNQLRHTLFIVGVAGVVASAILGFLLATRALLPVRKAYERQLQFVSDASHEMRTPLAVIQANLGLVLEHTDESVLDNLEWIHNAHAESRRLNKLVQDLLTLARSDAEKAPLMVEAVNLSELAHAIVDLFQPIAQVNHLQLTENIEPQVTINGDADRLKQLVIILLDNAMKFTPEGGTVTLSVRMDRSYATVSVEDTGIGIDKSDLKRIFHRFYQSDSARSRHESGGSGLGLSIAKWIVDAHHGKIDVSSVMNQGTTFAVRLPKHTV